MACLYDLINLIPAPKHYDMMNIWNAYHAVKYNLFAQMICQAAAYTRFKDYSIEAQIPRQITKTVDPYPFFTFARYTLNIHQDFGNFYSGILQDPKLPTPQNFLRDLHETMFQTDIYVLSSISYQLPLVNKVTTIGKVIQPIHGYDLKKISIPGRQLVFPAAEILLDESILDKHISCYANTPLHRDIDIWVSEYTQENPKKLLLPLEAISSLTFILFGYCGD